MVKLSFSHTNTQVQGGHFKNTYELVNLGAHEFGLINKLHIFQSMVRYFVWNFKGDLWNSTLNILPIHWKRPFLFSNENVRALRFMRLYMFLNTPTPRSCIYTGLALEVLKNKFFQHHWFRRQTWSIHLVMHVSHYVGNACAQILAKVSIMSMTYSLPF